MDIRFEGLKKTTKSNMFNCFELFVPKLIVYNSSTPAMQIYEEIIDENH